MQEEPNVIAIILFIVAIGISAGAFTYCVDKIAASIQAHNARRKARLETDTSEEETLDPEERSVISRSYLEETQIQNGERV